MKKRFPYVIITPDGWGYLLDGDKSVALGDIDVDFVIKDMRIPESKNKKINKLAPLIHKMRNEKMSITDISLDTGLSKDQLFIKY